MVFLCNCEYCLNFFALALQVMQLRKACSHPYLFPGIEPEPYEEGEHLVQVACSLFCLLHVGAFIG